MRCNENNDFVTISLGYKMCKLLITIDGVFDVEMEDN